MDKVNGSRIRKFFLNNIDRKTRRTSIMIMVTSEFGSGLTLEERWYLQDVFCELTSVQQIPEHIEKAETPVMVLILVEFISISFEEDLKRFEFLKTRLGELEVSAETASQWGTQLVL